MPYQALTQVEEMLISAMMPLMLVYRLPHGEYCYSGHVINLLQDVVSFTSNFPRDPSQLDLIVVRKEVPNESHQDFMSEAVLCIEPFNGSFLITSTIVQVVYA